MPPAAASVLRAEAPLDLPRHMQTRSSQSRLCPQAATISKHLVGGLQELRIYSEQSPGQGFAGAEADLEDVYFHHLTRHRPN